MNIQPTGIERIDDDTIEITWSDHARQRYSAEQLRGACPCASCREKRNSPPEPAEGGLPVLSAAEAQPMRIAGMKPVGTYAYTIEFNDGHDTGIFSYDLLRSLGEPV